MVTLIFVVVALVGGGLAVYYRSKIKAEAEKVAKAAVDGVDKKL